MCTRSTRHADARDGVWSVVRGMGEWTAMQLKVPGAGLNPFEKHVRYILVRDVLVTPDT